ncbi:MBL fold metallo-hydrolase [uncultured Senegalimassilia sp.]|uniref:MBL fold metallo-hydrolase n=1 Tax=uncultured Senegalimassilia sp. TaxID=1714350 RepID=UPI0025E80B14|nr:MBL fold metallo-hydrolase [uncultured Senegalimassilia sp.]
MLALHVLASGSSGNAAVIENTATGAGVLIDCGICKRDFLNRCDEAGFDPGRIQAMFVTHEHGDHVNGLGVVLRGLAKIGNVPPVFAAGACTANSSALAKVAEAFDVRELTAACAQAGSQGIANATLEDATPHAAVAPAGQGLTARAAGPGAVEAAGMRIIPFATSHDAAASFGFRIEDAADGDAIGYLTDSGIITAQAHAALRDVRILALESNHDPKMLAAGPYPYVIKQRIASNSGHLSNDQAAAELGTLVAESRTAGLRLPQTVVAMHVSQNNNDYSLARRTLEAALREAGCYAETLCGYQARLTTAR